MKQLVTNCLEKNMVYCIYLEPLNSEPIRTHSCTESSLVTTSASAAFAL